MVCLQAASGRLQNKRDRQMINLVLISGFLGAGKTTMMKAVLSSYEGCRTGVIVNEFGEINIDAKLLRHEGVQIEELSNGSIFCACIKDKFVDSLIQMSERDIDYLFIEASGLADPANMTSILDGIKSKLSEEYDYKGSVCIIDGENFMDLYELLPAIESQLEFCSAAIINKSDIAGEEKIEKIIETVNEINPQTCIYVTSYCRVDIRDIIDNLVYNPRKARATTNTVEARPLTFVLKGTDIVPVDRLKVFLENIIGDTYRVKGFAETDAGNVEISSVGNNLYVNPWNERIARTEIVVISAIGFKMMSVLTENIQNFVKGYISL